MGLNISVYRVKKFLGDTEPEDENWDFITYDKKTNERNGYYEGERIGDSGNIPYSSYNMLREKLCELTIGINIREVWEHPKSVYPFIDIINFSDSGGSIDNNTCQRLYAEFIDWESKIKELSENDKYFLNFYDKMLNLFKLAIDNNGLIIYN